MSEEHQTRIRWAIVFVLVAVMVVTRVNAQGPVHWSSGFPELAACDDLVSTDGYEAATFCVVRYQAAASGVWTESAGAEFAQALPILGLFLVAGLGYSLGSGLVPR